MENKQITARGSLSFRQMGHIINFISDLAHLRGNEIHHGTLDLWRTEGHDLRRLFVLCEFYFDWFLRVQDVGLRVEVPDCEKSGFFVFVHYECSAFGAILEG